MTTILDLWYSTQPCLTEITVIKNRIYPSIPVKTQPVITEVNVFFNSAFLYPRKNKMFSGICLSEPLVTDEASGVPVGLKNKFDLKHYIDDLKRFDTMLKKKNSK